MPIASNYLQMESITKKEGFSHFEEKNQIILPLLLFYVLHLHDYAFYMARYIYHIEWDCFSTFQFSDTLYSLISIILFLFILKMKWQSHLGGEHFVTKNSFLK
jgi:hypothetical protein